MRADLRGLPAVQAAARRMVDDRRGTVAVIFALSLAPLLFMAGAALDYSGAANLRTQLQKATDGTNLALCQMPVATSVQDLTAEAGKMMGGYLGATPYRIESISTTTNPWTVSINTSANFQTAIVKGLSASFANIPVGASARCYGQPQTFEIALVLDNTGSMANSGGGSSKIQALRQAATNFVNYIFADPKIGPKSRISLVPFAAAVAVDPSTYRSAGWVDTLGLSPYHWSIAQGGAASAITAGFTSRFSVFNKLKTAQSSWDWTGCFESLPYPLNTQDISPSTANPSSLFIPMLAPDESGSGGENPNNAHRDGSNNYMVSINSYLDDYDGTALCPTTSDEYARNGRMCKYNSLRNARTSNSLVTVGPNVACTTRPLTRLTRDQSLLLNEISQMQPSGSTNVHEGLMWGWRTLSPVSMFKSGTTDQTPAPYDTIYNNKIIILMTDGANTWNASPFSDTQPNYYSVLKSYYSAYGYLKNSDGTGPAARLGSANASAQTGTDTRAAIDGLTSQGCTAFKSTSTGGKGRLIIYTIGFSVPGDAIDQQGLNLLTSCASDSAHAYTASDSTTLQTIFQQIAQDIGALRLTN